MIKKQEITAIICMLISLSGISSTSAIASMVPYEPMEIEAPQTNPSKESDVNLNYKFFEVNVGESDDYYAKFWLLPAKYEDGTYTKFSVYVNDQFVGHITPAKDNWQAARIDGNETIELKKGSNLIKVAVPSPEMPAVETVRIALTDSEAEISSSAYDEFYNKAVDRISYNVPQEAQCICTANSIQTSKQTPEFPVKHFSDIPLKYTFYKEFYFEEGEWIHVMSSSLSEHDLDVLYLGKKNPTAISNMSLDNISDSTEDYPLLSQQPLGVINSTTINNPVPVYAKLMPLYILGTSEEWQGLNWKGVSIKVPSPQNNIISKNIKIPKSGIYMFRLRHRESGKTGIANMTVIDKYKSYSYNSVPISFSWVQCEIPANGNEYGSMTICNDPENDDPVLFMHGADADRVVGFGDDAPYDMRMIHNLSVRDSHILQEYKVPTSGISVCNYSSLLPESKCEILAGMDESLFELDPEFQLMPKANRENDLSEFFTLLNDIKISGFMEQCGVMTVTSKTEIHNVTVTDLYGTLIGSFKGNGTSMNISRALLNITKSGIYIVSVKTEKGIVSKKMLIE